MPKPIETLLSLPRVRLANRVPILETEAYIRRFMERIDCQPKLVNPALQVSNRSAHQFAMDDEGLSTLLSELENSNYIVTSRSREVMQHLLDDILNDGYIYKEFEREIKPLIDISVPLRQASQLTSSLADRTHEETFDVSRALLIPAPRRSEGKKK